MRCLRLRHGIKAKFLAHMSEFFGIGQTSIAHHPAQLVDPRLSEEQSRQALAGIKPHQPPFQKALGSRRQFRLAGVWATAPGPEHKSLGNRGKGGEEHVELAPDIVPLASGEPDDWLRMYLAHLWHMAFALPETATIEGVDDIGHSLACDQSGDHACYRDVINNNEGMKGTRRKLFRLTSGIMGGGSWRRQ